MERNFVQEALRALRPDTPDWYGWAKVDADGNKIPNDQRMCWQHAIVTQDGVTKPTEAEFNAKVAELQAAHDEANAPYKLNRAAEYPSIADQLDKIYHEGIDAWKADIKAVKDKYPKPQ